MKNKKISLVIIISIMLVSISCSLLERANPLDNNGDSSNETDQGNQNNISLPDGASLKIDQGSLPNGIEGSIELISKEKRSYDEFSQVGNLYEVSFGGVVLDKPATLTLPYDPDSLPEDVDPETLFIAYFNEDMQDWQFIGGDVDTENHLITVKTDHASRWSVFDWNFDAWIPILDDILSLNLVSWYEAADLLTDDCPQSGVGIWVDNVNSGNMIQGCVEEDEKTEAVLRVVNPKSFYYEITADAEEQGIQFSELLSPGGSYEFKIDKLDPPPIEVRAVITQKAGLRLVLHWFLSYLPGLNAMDIQPQEVDCVAERLEQEGIPHLTSAIDDLIGGDTTSGVKASASLTELWLDIDFLELFLEAAGVCIDYLPATWSLDNISQIASSSSVIIEGWEYLANYIVMVNRGESAREVVFNWTQMGPSMLNTIPPTNELTNTPESQNANLAVVEMGGIYTYFWLTYDPVIWRISENDFGLILTLRDDPNCEIHENPGMGIVWPDNQQYQKQIASYTVNITQYLTNGKISYEIFYFNSENIYIAIDTGNNPEKCLEAARSVVEISAESNFGPD